MKRCYLLDKVAFSRYTNRIKYQGPYELFIEGYKALKKAVLFDATSGYSSYTHWVNKLTKTYPVGNAWVKKELTLAIPPWDNTVVVMEQSEDTEVAIHVLRLNCDDYTDLRSDQAKEESPITPNGLWAVTGWVMGTKVSDNHLAFTSIAYTEEAGNLGPFIKEVLLGTEKLVTPVLTPDWVTVCIYPFFVFQLLHCRGIGSETLPNYCPTVPKGQRSHLPKVSYHTLAIGSELHSPAHNGSGEGPSGSPKAKHLCRGSFARYTPERPLFGHYSGLVWRPAHVRGSAKLGIVGKEYKLADS